MTLIIAGYTAAPTDKRDAAFYYEQLFAAPRVRGLELGWNGTNTQADIQADIADLLTSVPAGWVFTLSAIRSTYQSWFKDHRFGLASADEDGRRAAVDMARAITDAIKAINDNTGRRALTAVELHAAPGFNDRTYNPNPHAFARSLQQVADLDWSGTAVIVEHCDALVPTDPCEGISLARAGDRCPKESRRLPDRAELELGPLAHRVARSGQSGRPSQAG